MFVVIIIITVVIRTLLWGYFNMTHNFHSSSWLLQHFREFLNKSNYPKKMNYILNELYNSNFHYLTHASKSILLLEDVIQPDEKIIRAFCGVRFEDDGHRGHRYSPILLITSKRILYVNGEYHNIKTINPNSVKSVTFKRRLPLLRRNGLKLEFKNRRPLFLELISKDDCDWIANVISSRESNM